MENSPDIAQLHKAEHTDVSDVIENVSIEGTEHTEGARGEYMSAEKDANIEPGIPGRESNVSEETAKYLSFPIGESRSHTEPLQGSNHASSSKWPLEHTKTASFDERSQHTQSEQLDGEHAQKETHHVQDPVRERASKRLKVDTSSPMPNTSQISTNETVKEPTPSLQPNRTNSPSVPPHSQEPTTPSQSQTPIEGDQSQPQKLTKRQEERLAKQKLREIERVERERKKEEERKQKQEEREKKDLERKQKKELMEKEKQEKREAERLRKEEKRLKMEEERQAKELERKNKEQEKRKAEQTKDRSQMKISNFFALKPASEKASSKPSFFAPVKKSSVSEQPIEVTKQTPDTDSYHSDFLPFFQKSNVLLAPSSRLTGDVLETSKSAFDSALGENKSSPDLATLFSRFPPKPSQTVTSSQQMVDALNSAQMTESALFSLVTNLPPIKYLQFYENAKPPYVGTWCSEKHLSTPLSPTQPLNTLSTGFDYDYDSDLDWQEGDEGDEEDIDDLDEGDEEEDDVEDGEMEDFVDDNGTSKRGHVGPLQSVSIWNDGSSNEIFDALKYERLHWDIEFPIDPFKDYWTKEPKPQPESAEKSVVSSFQAGTPKKVETERSSAPNVLTPQKPVIKDAKVVESLVEFIQKNSDFSIGTLAELAKKEFKVYTKSILKHTIQDVAVYNKKKGWEIKGVVGESK